MLTLVPRHPASPVDLGLPSRRGLVVSALLGFENTCALAPRLQRGKIRIDSETTAVLLSQAEVTGLLFLGGGADDAKHSRKRPRPGRPVRA